MRRKGRKRVAPKAKGGAQLTKRRGRRIRKGFLYLIICGIITAVLVYSPVFTLRNIEMKGAVYLTEDDIVTITQIQKGDPLLKMKTDVMQKNLMKDLRIESAVVKRHLPGTIEIDLVERKPVATVACDYGYLDFDRNGKVLMGYQEIKKMQIPFITGTVMISTLAMTTRIQLSEKCCYFSRSLMNLYAAKSRKSMCRTRRRSWRIRQM